MTKYHEVYIPKDSIFEHLTDRQLQKLVKEYYSPNLPNMCFSWDILKKYNVPVDKAHYLPPLQHHDCICPDCEVVSWIKLSWDESISQPFCPVCRVYLRSYIHSADKMFYMSDKEIEEFTKNLHQGPKIEIPFLNKLHV